jgi:hypothetical protein
LHQGGAQEGGADVVAYLQGNGLRIVDIPAGGSSSFTTLAVAMSMI